MSEPDKVMLQDAARIAYNLRRRADSVPGWKVMQIYAGSAQEVAERMEQLLEEIQRLRADRDRYRELYERAVARAGERAT